MAAIRDSLQEGETEDIPEPNMNAQPPRIQTYDQVIKVLKKFLIWILSVSSPIVMGIIFIIVFSSLQHQVDMGLNHEQGCEQIYIEDGLLISSCIPEETALNGNTNKTTEAITITDVHPSLQPKKSHLEVQSYDNNAVKTFVGSLHNPQKQQKLEQSYHYISSKIYSKDAQAAIQRNVIEKRKFAIADIKKIPRVVDVLARDIAKQFNKEDHENGDLLQSALDELKELVEIEVDDYGNDMKSIGLNTEIGGKSKFLAAILHLKITSDGKMQVAILMHLEEWIVKDGWKINGECKDGDKMCWDSVRIKEFLQYQMFNDYMQEIEQNESINIESSGQSDDALGKVESAI